MSQSYGKGSNIDEWYQFWIGLGIFFIVAFSYVLYINNFDIISIIGSSAMSVMWFYTFRKIQKARDHSSARG